jgi:hypothetical protein
MQSPAIGNVCGLVLFTNSVADEKPFLSYRLRQVAETPISQEDELG